MCGDTSNILIEAMPPVVDDILRWAVRAILWECIIMTSRKVDFLRNRGETL